MTRGRSSRKRGRKAPARVAQRRSAPLGRAFVGVSGYDYPHWRGAFYPAGLPAREHLPYAASLFDSIELNGTFYSLKSPDAFRRWASAVPSGFVFAIKGSRFITHNLKLARCEGALANFYASGVLALGRKTGPFLWQLPRGLRFDAARVEAFLRLLPRDTSEAESLARGHDARLRRGALTKASGRLRYRHAFEVRHPSFASGEFLELLRRHGCALVVADTAGLFPLVEEVTCEFVYARLHGSRELYASGYTAAELDDWSARLVSLARRRAPRRPSLTRRQGPRGQPARRGARDLYVYFDNDAKAHAPRDAMSLARRLARRGLRAGPRRPGRRIRT